MGPVERGVVKPPNMPDTAGDKRNNGFLPLTGGAGTVHQSSFQGPGGDRRGGSFPLGGAAPAIHDIQRRFNVDEVPGSHAPMPFPDEPGKGAVPVNPFLPGGAAARSVAVSDEAKPRPGR